MDIFRWIRVNKSTEISSMMMLTLDYDLFKQIRHAIRVYTGMSGYRIETYEKAEFVKKCGLTMYVHNANLSAGQLLRTLFISILSYTLLTLFCSAALLSTLTSLTNQRTNGPALGTAFYCLTARLFLRNCGHLMRTRNSF